MLDGRIMGLDIGDKTIGVAVSDLMGLTAQGVTTIKRVGKKGYRSYKTNNSWETS